MDDQEAMETLSLKDFPVSPDHQNPPTSSPADNDVFEFSKGGLSDDSEENMMSNAEDIIFCGKLVPINQQIHRKRPSQQRSCRRSRSESRSDVKNVTVSPLAARNSRSVDYKKLRRYSSMSSDPPAEPSCTGSAAGYGKNSGSSLRNVILYGLVNVPQPEMNVRDLKNRRVRLNTSKARSDLSETVDEFRVGRKVDNRKCSWRVLELLSCKSSSAAVTMPLSYMAKV
ncbi:hypothetical protein Hdeb2414_s0014g00428111 [Helianthus debilis subsp. tardiflorus]